MDNIEVGYLKGESCNRDGCIGVIDEYETENSCSCHINPPCSHCVESRHYCKECGWDGREEQIEEIRKDNLIQEKYREENKDHFKKMAEDQEKWRIKREEFYKKYNTGIGIDELEMVSESHTHFSMKIKGIFPKGTETRDSILEKVKGTFGGRFEIGITEDSFRFCYIAYTD